jgi:flagella basal body P-ring formation protein FlgA
MIRMLARLVGSVMTTTVRVCVVALFGATTLAAQPSSPAGTVRLTLSVATRDLARGDTLAAGDFAAVDTTLVWHWTNSTPDTTQAQTGWITRRPIAKGELLRYPAVSAPPLVKAGTKVSVIYQDGPVRITLSGTATNTATLGAPVGVRVDPTRRLDGIAVAPNTVRLR